MHFTVSLNGLKHKTCYNKAFEVDPSFLQLVPDWFIKREWMWMWYDDYYDDGDHWDNDDEDKFFEWYDGYKKQKTQKASIKEDLLPSAWHPSRHWGVCQKMRKKW